MTSNNRKRKRENDDNDLEVLRPKKKIRLNGAGFIQWVRINNYTMDFNLYERFGSWLQSDKLILIDDTMIGMLYNNRGKANLTRLLKKNDIDYEAKLYDDIDHELYPNISEPQKNNREKTQWIFMTAESFIYAAMCAGTDNAKNIRHHFANIQKLLWQYDRYQIQQQNNEIDDLKKIIIDMKEKFSAAQFTSSAHYNIISDSVQDIHKELKLFKECKGCREGQLNQLAHMDEGGCLFETPIKKKNSETFDDNSLIMTQIDE